MQSYLLKDTNGKLSTAQSKVHPASLPGFPIELEVVGLESEFNPNGLDVSVSALQEVELEASYQVLVQPAMDAQAEILAQAEVPAQAEILAVAAVPEKWIKDGQADVSVDPLDVAWTHVPAVAEVVGVPAVVFQPAVPYQAAVPASAAIYNTVLAVKGMRVVADSTKQTLKEKSILIAQAYELMNSEVLAQMSVVFGTSNTASASANKDTWQMMIDEPALYVPSKFATVEEVVAFATAKMNAVKVYAVWRETRIDAFRTYKISLES